MVIFSNLNSELGRASYNTQWQIQGALGAQAPQAPNHNLHACLTWFCGFPWSWLGIRVVHCIWLGKTHWSEVPVRFGDHRHLHHSWKIPTKSVEKVSPFTLYGMQFFFQTVENTHCCCWSCCPPQLMLFMPKSNLLHSLDYTQQCLIPISNLNFPEIKVIIQSFLHSKLIYIARNSKFAKFKVHLIQSFFTQFFLVVPCC